MKKLRLTASLHDDETVTSYVGRLAALNFQPSTDDFCRDMGTTLQSVSMGKKEALHLIASISGEGLGRLTSAAFERTNAQTRTFRGQAIINSIRSTRAIRFCLSCLRDDIARATNEGARHPHQAFYGRPQWLILPYRTCVRHNIALASIHVNSSLKRDDFIGAVTPLLNKLQDHPTEPTTRQSSDFERYLEQRLLWPGKGCLHNFGYSVTARLCELLGAVTMCGPRPPYLTFSDGEWQQVGDAGYKIVSAGSETLLAALNELKKTDSGREEAHKDWGILYDWMAAARDPEMSPLLSLARTHIEQNYPLAAGRQVLGQRVQARQVHSITTAAKELGVPVLDLRIQLEGAGVVSTEDHRVNNRILLDVANTSEFLDRFARGITALDARRRIQCDRQIFGTLVEAGILKPIADVEPAHLLFDTRDLDALMDAIESNAEPYPVKPSNLASISETRMKLQCKFVDIAKLLNAGRLKNVGRLEGKRGYAAILLEPTEVGSLLQIGELDGIGLTQIIADLGVHKAGLEQMLEVQLPSVTQWNPKSRHFQRVVDNAIYQSFKEKYVSIRDLARAAGVNSKRYRMHLAENGISHEREFPEGVYLYRRDALS